MAVAPSSSSAGLVKAVVLPLMLVVLVVAAGASSMEDGPAIAKSGGRFSETPGGRKLLNFDLCGLGSAPDYSCKTLLLGAKNATCCRDGVGNDGACIEVGGQDVTNCGSCFNVCQAGHICCSGVCVDQLTDKNNCGICANICPGTVKCKSGICGY